MHNLLVACQELDALALEQYRFQGVVDLTGGIPAVAGAIAGGLLEERVPSEEEKVEIMDALKWATKLEDLGILENLSRCLPSAILNEQIRLYKAHLAAPDAVAVTEENKPLRIDATQPASRNAVALRFDEYLKARDIDAAGRLPRNCIAAFLVAECDLRPRHKMDIISLKKKIRSWHVLWRQLPTVSMADRKPLIKSKIATIREHKRRRRQGLQGKPPACQIVRQQLFDWFMTMRYSIDWHGLERQLRSGGKVKCIGRFTRSLLLTKVKQLLQNYVHECLVHGQPAQIFVPRSDWFSRFENEYGLSMRKPNRKYKVPKAVLEQRLEIEWLNLSRIRALCVKVHGYDPEMENWDQSPFHNNEVGSQNVPTLSVEGCNEVPLIENHTATRERWSGNFTTFSNKQRILNHGPPYMELMFKADGHIVERRLREHVRSRGYGPWLTVATSPKGSYREADVLNFLEHHLPVFEGDRRWRIILADDYAPHKCDNVRRLCWSRGYVLVAHGGGVTPVVQTPDTDLNQHVRREYTAKESAELIHQMSQGICVPRAKEEASIDMMAEVLSNLTLHLNAAEGYKKTGQTIALNGDEDDLVVREAGVFFRELNMRPKINFAVAEVNDEVAAGRLNWSREEVESLIRPYPSHKDIDEVLEKLGDYMQLEEEEKPFAEEECDEEEGDKEHGAEELVVDESAVADVEHVDVDLGEITGLVDIAVAEAEEGADAMSHGIVLTPEEAEILHKSQTMIEVYTQSLEALRACGAMTAAVHLENEIRKEKRRQRTLGRENNNVAQAMARRRDVEREETLKQRRLAADANTVTQAAAKTKRELAVAATLVQKRKAELIELESLKESKHTMKRFSLEHLGDGNAKGGGVAARKRRFEVLDRLVRIGSCLSTAQKNDWVWFKEAWDEKMLEEHKSEWGGVFATWMQQVLDDYDRGMGNAMSVFVHKETRRCFDIVPALLVPGAAVAAS
jgi:hypothetical protein